MAETNDLTPVWIWTAQDEIDKALDNWKHQSMIAQTAVVDLLLDLRSLLADD